MVNLTLSVPEELKKKMDTLPEFNWSEIARQAIAQRIKDYEIMKNFVSKSKMTQEDAMELGRKVNKAVAKRYLERWKSL